MANNSIFLTGGSGLLGSAILNNLLDSDYEVWPLSRSDQAIETPSKLIHGDLMDPVSYEDSLKGIQTIIHCAALISYDSRDREKLYKVNVQATRDLVNAALYQGVSEFILISSASTMVRSANENLVSDRAVGLPVFKSYYAETKYLAELEVWRALAEGMKVSILNPSLILGVSDWNRSSMQIFQKVKNGLRYYPPGHLGLIAAPDLAEIVLWILKKNLWNQQFLLNAETWTYKDFLNKIAQELALPPIDKPATFFSAKILAGIDSINQLLSHKPALINAETIRSSFSPMQFDDLKTRENLAYPYRAIDSWISQLCKSALI